MFVSVIPSDQAPDVIVIVKLADPTAAEIRAMTKDHGSRSRPPLVWFTLMANKLDLDAPYGVGIEKRAPEIQASYEQLQHMGPEKRR